jgi:hypothetical protein
MEYSTLALTSAIVRGGWSKPRPGCFTPGKTQYALDRRLGGLQGRSGRVQISPTPGFDTRTVQPVASRYTDWAVPAVNNCVSILVSVNRHQNHYPCASCFVICVLFFCAILGSIAKLWKVTINFDMSVRPSVCPLATTRLPLVGFPWNMIFE